MTALVLEPHPDDCALFCAFTAIREQAMVITVLQSAVQERYGITAAARETENGNAMAVLELGWQQWAYPDSDPPWDEIELRLKLLALPTNGFDRVFVPASLDGGHEHHNRVAAAGEAAFGDRVAGRYLTYTRAGKSTDGHLVRPEPEWVTRKLRALACYRSQIETPAAGCMPHFMRGLDEYLAP